MDNREFGSVLEQARSARGISRPDLAAKMAGSKSAAKGVEGQLWRYEQAGEKGRKPREDKLYEIVDALSSLANDSDAEKDLILRELMTAAGMRITDEEQVEYLRRQCEIALQGVGHLKDHEIQTILDHVSDSTMKRIVKAAREGEEIDFIQLNALSAELQAAATRHSGDAVDQHGGFDTVDHVIPAGRARILVDGKLTTAQTRLLDDIANMIRTALDEQR